MGTDLTFKGFSPHLNSRILPWSPVAIVYQKRDFYYILTSSFPIWFSFSMPFIPLRPQPTHKKKAIPIKKKKKRKSNWFPGQVGKNSPYFLLQQHHSITTRNKR